MAEQVASTMESSITEFNGRMCDDLKRQEAEHTGASELESK